MKTLYSLFFLVLFSSVSAQHSVVLKSGDKIDCVVLSLNNDVWKVYENGEERMISMKEISSVFFNEYVPYDGVFIPSGKETTLKVGDFTVKYLMKDRKMIREPRVSIGTQDKGAVVVKVVVDRYGNVLSAEPGQSGSTTSNNYLYIKAETAAKTAKFDENLKGPLKTEGAITIVY
tara:strand:+ start:1435 stop:1959 length:525 start_codon:yes stop_codon:yes gene_type:complete